MPGTHKAVLALYTARRGGLGTRGKSIRSSMVILSHMVSSRLAWGFRRTPSKGKIEVKTCGQKNKGVGIEYKEFLPIILGFEKYRNLQ